jgi:nucleotide-binding universal stress UspA family protein
VPQTHEGVPQKIVVGVDGSPSSKRALRWAVRQGQLTGCPVEAMTAWEYPTAIFGWAPSLPADYDLAAEAGRALDAAVDDALGASQALEVRRAVKEGQPALVLVEASHDASLLVVGSRGHGAFVGMLIGSVSEHCVANAHCPVVVIRGPEA